MDLTGRSDFIETWLCEMPEGLGKFPTFDTLEYCIKDRIAHGSKPIEIAPNIKKIIGQQVIYYWIESNNDVVLGTELYIKPQGLIVGLTGKNPKWVGHKPYASDLYDIVLKDNNKSLRLFSDNSLSDEGYNIWKRLFNQGHTVSVYDREQPGKTFTTLYSLDDMDKYFKYDDTDFKRYQYVLSEQNVTLAETRSYFHIRRHRELIPGLL